MTGEFTKQILESLAKPFPRIRWRPQRIVTKNGKHWAIMIAYIDSRDVIDRLNEIVGPENWSFEWKSTEDNKKVVHGKLTLFGAIREDVGYPNNLESKTEQHLKSSVSDALKRCAVQFGVGRFLYDLPNEFIQYTENSSKGKPVNPNDLKRLEEKFKAVK